MDIPANLRWIFGPKNIIIAYGYKFQYNVLFKYCSHVRASYGYNKCDDNMYEDFVAWSWYLTQGK